MQDLWASTPFRPSMLATLRVDGSPRRVLTSNVLEMVGRSLAASTVSLSAFRKNTELRSTMVREEYIFAEDGPWLSTTLSSPLAFG